MAVKLDSYTYSDRIVLYNLYIDPFLHPYGNDGELDGFLYSKGDCMRQSRLTTAICYRSRPIEGRDLASALNYTLVWNTDTSGKKHVNFESSEHV